MNNTEKICEFPFRYCILDHNIWYHALRRVDRFDHKDESSRKILIKLMECPSNVKIIIDVSYREKLYSILNVVDIPQDTDTIKFLKSCQTVFLGRGKTKFIEEFNLNSECYMTYDQYLEELDENSPHLKDDDFFLYRFSKVVKSLVISNDEGVYNALKFKGISVFYSDEVIRRFDP